MGSILLIEDETPIVVAIEDALEEAGYSVLTARNGQQGLKYALEERYDLMILDLMLPKMNGLDILKQVRSKEKETPVIILTAKSLERDKVKGFDLGADDYMTKPFGVKELLARVKVRLKNAVKKTTRIEAYQVGGIDFNFAAMTASKKGQAVPFSVREMELLQYLIEHEGRVLSREQILEDVWHYDLDQMPLSRSLDNYILKLRQKIEKKVDDPDHLLTVYGKGYRFVDDRKKK